MSVDSFRWTFVGLLITDFVAMLLLEPQTIGVSAMWSNDRYRFAGGTHPWFFAIAVAIVATYFALMNKAIVGPGAPLSGLIRRFAAFWLDFVLAMMMIAPFYGILPAVVEWRRTGVFAWTFERFTVSASDSFLTIGGAGLSLVLLFLYYLLPLVRRRPSPGALIVGYQIVCDEGQSLSFSDAAARTLLGIIGIVGWFVTAFVGRERNKGKLWFDQVFHTRAVLL